MRAHNYYPTRNSEWFHQDRWFGDERDIRYVEVEACEDGFVVLYDPVEWRTEVITIEEFQLDYRPRGEVLWYER